MQYEDFISSLNETQLSAVESDSQFTRVIAGAGSGKTRVLTYRISYLISQLGIKPWKILAFTFTNKAANEMANRIVQIIPECRKDLTIKTFHSFAAFFLRQEISVLNYPANFTILDEEDQTKIIKDIVSEMGYKKNDPIVKTSINYIGSCKLDEKYPGDVKIVHERFEGEKECLEIYERYEDIKSRQYALDFDDLLLKTNEILNNYTIIREKWRSKYEHILIDEFQDTNNTEYKMIKNLMKPSTSLYVVGDPDQTIYTWRGANQSIILDLNENFHNVNTIILNRNYRSTQNILDDANRLIAHNKYRVPKDLYTNNIKGHEVVVNYSDSGIQEANYVAKEIEYLRNNQHYQYRDITILYRSNYVTLDFEKALMARRIPYVIYGGVKFYQRMEVKDVIAYFRLINNVKDDVSFERIMNVPKRGIGDKATLEIKTGAANANLSMYEYVLTDDALGECSPKAIKSLRTMIARIEVTKNQIKEGDEMFAKNLEDLINDIGYYDHLKLLDDGDDRLDNVKSLFDDLRNYLSKNENATFEEYLQNISLVSAQDDIIDGDHVTLMTVHTAKGLEFPVVFVVRMSEGIFPNQRALDDGGYMGMEEERRLAYVAMTRAKERLYLTASHGYSYVLKGELTQSRFIKEAGHTMMNRPTSIKDFYSNPYGTQKKKYKYDFDDVRNEDTKFDDEPIRQDFSQETNNVSSWQVGDIVEHVKFGRGVVTSLEGDNIIVVEFENHGSKTLLGNHKFLSKGSK